jgi:hypothetical protein
VTLIKPGTGILFMKIGTHAQEPLADIVARKTIEIEEAGYALWGYGGNTCHPQTMVQPFARSFEQRGSTIYLCMEEMASSHFAQPIRADESSEDGMTWTAIPPSINVRGSRYALVITDLRKDSMELPLAQTRVAIGNSQGRGGDRYIAGRVDKACLEITDVLPDPLPPDEARTVQIGLVARLIPPYAVYVRNRP